MDSLHDVLSKHNLDGNEVLYADLLAREDAIADSLRAAGMQLGAMPEFVAKALMDVGLGTPPDPDTRQFLDAQFATRLEWLQQQFGIGGDPAGA